MERTLLGQLMKFDLDCSLDNSILSMLISLKLIIVLCLYRRMSLFLEIFRSKGAQVSNLLSNIGLAIKFFGFFHKKLQKSPNRIFGQPIVKKKHNP